MATPFDCVEVRFKWPKRILPQYRELTLSMGDIVATVASPGHDIGIVTGRIGSHQMKKKGANPLSNEIPKIYRKASQKTLTFGLLLDKEEPMKVRARELAIAQNWK
jgi:hypothetical protein